MENRKPYGEFVAIIALLVSLTALAIDAMLPALSNMSDELGISHENDRQLIISFVFLGMAVGQFLFGPISDSLGRKSPVMVGLLLFTIGSIISAVSVNLEWMLVGRFIQGLGAAGPRTLSAAIVRDQFRGNAMARIMSLIMVVFILVPVLAPALGQGILLISHWRMIFWTFVGLSVTTSIWFWLRQPETLPPENRIPFSMAAIGTAGMEVVKHPVTRSYTLALSFVFAAFVGYLSTSQQILQELYGTGDLFAVYFSFLAFGIGCAAFVNSKLVMRFKITTLCRCALATLVVLSLLCLLFHVYRMPTLNEFMTYLIFCFFCFGILFGNLNAMAMEPMGHIAGMAAAVIGSVSTLISLFFGFFVGQAYDSTIIPLIISFALFPALALLAIHFTKAPDQSESH
ncbi:MAG: Bcr/CflA family efflux MFS transporter [Gammaproteobacteria bacterium]|nr:Bcr/CflA family efflux MFS transporter [Gammaproteobacteria bacterium]